MHKGFEKIALVLTEMHCFTLAVAQITTTITDSIKSIKKARLGINSDYNNHFDNWLTLFSLFVFITAFKMFNRSCFCIN